MLNKNDSTNSFIVHTFNFFKNDYLVIKDFLFNRSPWDKYFVYELKISFIELEHLKSAALSILFDTYYNKVLAPLDKSDKVPVSCAADLYVNKEIQEIKYRLISENMFNDEAVAGEIDALLRKNSNVFIQIFKYYIGLLMDKDYNMEEHLYNKFRHNIVDLYNIYQKLYCSFNVTNISDESELKVILNRFTPKLDEKVKKYFIDTFRSQDEVYQFVDYLVSIVYAYVYDSIENGRCSLSEEQSFLESIEYSDNLMADFLGDSEFMLAIMENLNIMYRNEGDYYDKRDELPDLFEIFDKLDPTYNSDKKNYLMDSIFDDVKLVSVLDAFDEDGCTIREIISALTDKNHSIFDILFLNDLDARFEDYYKKELVKRILVGVYEYELYLLNFKPDKLKYKHYEEIIHINFNDWNKVYNYFIKHANTLIETYYLYRHSTLYVRECVLLHTYNSKEYKNIDRMSKYSISRFIPVCSKRIKQLQSVDYMNMCIRVVVDNYNGISKEQKIDMINCMCLNIYENVISGTVDTEHIDEFIEFFERLNNPGAYLVNYPEKLKIVERLFLRINGICVSYSGELELRKNIKDDKHIKMLKKLNPFDE